MASPLRPPVEIRQSVDMMPDRALAQWAARLIRPYPASVRPDGTKLLNPTRHVVRPNSGKPTFRTEMLDSATEEDTGHFDPSRTDIPEPALCLNVLGNNLFESRFLIRWSGSFITLLGF